MQSYGYGTRRSRGHQFVSAQIPTCSNTCVAVLGPSGPVACGPTHAAVIALRRDLSHPLSHVPDVASSGGTSFFRTSVFVLNALHAHAFPC